MGLRTLRPPCGHPRQVYGPTAILLIAHYGGFTNSTSVLLSVPVFAAKAGTRSSELIWTSAYAGVKLQSTF